MSHESARGRVKTCASNYHANVTSYLPSHRNMHLKHAHVAVKYAVENRTNVLKQLSGNVK